jgi:hypothetical protein
MWYWLDYLLLNDPLIDDRRLTSLEPSLKERSEVLIADHRRDGELRMLKRECGCGCSHSHRQAQLRIAIAWTKIIERSHFIQVCLFLGHNRSNAIGTLETCPTLWTS